MRRKKFGEVKVTLLESNRATISSLCHAIYNSKSEQGIVLMWQRESTEVLPYNEPLQVTFTNLYITGYLVHWKEKDSKISENVFDTQKNQHSGIGFLCK